jgi:hypothetical protein
VAQPKVEKTKTAAKAGGDNCCDVANYVAGKQNSLNRIKNMKRIIISCVALAALAVPAVAADPNLLLVPKDIPNNGNFGNDRAQWAGRDPNFGASISARGGSNSIDNHLWMEGLGKSTGNSLQSLETNHVVECTGLGGQILGC